MLAIAFRSVLVPIKAIIMNTLSVSATFGLIVLVFQYGFGSPALRARRATEAIFVVVPVLVFAVVFGLSMDYEVFLLSRIKEAFDRTGRNDEATMEGLSATASVITSAALIMILVFGVFAFARVLAMQLLGFGLAVAVLLDATVIRMVLVPAFMQPMGRWNWWPGVGAAGPVKRRARGTPVGVGQRRSSVRTIVRPTRDSSPARLTSPQPSSTSSSMRPASARAPIPRRRSPTSADRLRRAEPDSPASPSPRPAAGAPTRPARRSASAGSLARPAPGGR